MSEKLILDESMDKVQLIENTKESLFLKQSKNIKAKKVPKNLEYINFIKIISSYGIVILHTNPFWGDNFKNKKRWIFTNLLEQFFHYTVPFFVLCVGATLLDFNEKYGLRIYYKRRFLKIVIPLVGWSILTYYYRIYFVKNLQKRRFSIAYILDLFFYNKIYGLFYSFHIFIVIYMIIPLLAYVKKEDKIYIYSYGFFIILINKGIIPYLIDIFNIRFIWPYKIKATGYILYIFSGYIIENHKFSRISKKIIYIIGFSFILVQIIGTYILTYKYQGINLTHTGFLKLPTILYSNAFFLFIKDNYYIFSRIFNKNLINKLGTLTIGPFFLHMPLMDFFKKFPILILNIDLLLI